VKCDECRLPIPAGAETTKMIVEYVQDDGTSRFFGYQMPDGPLTAATGRIARAWHGKHYHARRKREARGGSVFTAAEMDALGLSAEKAAAHTVELAQRVARLRQAAAVVGRPVGDSGVLEAFRAAERGGPYPHTHTMALDPYQLRAHLTYAHGADLTARPVGVDIGAHHAGMHASDRAGEIRRQREADPGENEPVEQDWREQHVAEIPERA